MVTKQIDEERINSNTLSTSYMLILMYTYYFCCCFFQAPQAGAEAPPPPAEPETPQPAANPVSKDPRYAKFFKMVQFVSTGNLLFQFAPPY